MYIATSSLFECSLSAAVPMTTSIWDVSRYVSTTARLFANPSTSCLTRAFAQYRQIASEISLPNVGRIHICARVVSSWNALRFASPENSPPLPLFRGSSGIQSQYRWSPFSPASSHHPRAPGMTRPIISWRVYSQAHLRISRLTA
jgi:hypothetical protein